MSDQPKNNYLLPIILSLLLAIGMCAGFFLNTVETRSTGDIQKLEDILTLLDQNYVDKVDKDAIFEETISDMLHKLDPHSNYISAKDMKSVNESIEGQFGGVGIRFLLLRDTICVTNIIANSPSYYAGIKAGDKIIKVNGKKMYGKGMTNEKVLATLKGQPGTKLQVTILQQEITHHCPRTRHYPTPFDSLCVYD